MLLNILGRWLIYITGIMVMSYGVCLCIGAGLGVLPWDVFHIGLSNHTFLTTGNAIQITGGILVAISSLITKSWPKVGTILNMILVGIFVDMFFKLNFLPSPSGLVFQFSMLLFGIFLFSFGGGMYLSSNLGAGPRDSLNLALAEKTRGSIRLIKTVLEVSALVFGYCLGGPVGIGTVITSLTVGYIFQSSIVFWRHKVSIWLPREQTVL